MIAKIAPQVISANRLTDGHVVYLGTDGAWLDNIAAAHVYPDGEAAAAGLEQARADVKKALILDPFLVEVATQAPDVTALKMRDKIRAKGPTINYAPHS
ncbi:DUF2849 domain-containing protein [Beijerinckia indica]|uniref:DUF2849 domain-containing protein n=1 Tax=Beijerinckia indica subsp. indica (strain ATCC 9039 / DSM 1715 / NCIMB 8712) TaxID=395963 RepID=B2IH92_BEII9|nr:DUF2849 domain-containing protein [Beijerinckia indica]ACB95877.1 conserved hypothetical protein [Beijerinckia indica subsp. indica ATCC 9039]